MYIYTVKCFLTQVLHVCLLTDMYNNDLFNDGIDGEDGKRSRER